MRRLAALFLLLLALPVRAAEPSLISDLSQERIDINTTFKGADLLVFGAIQYPAGRVPERAPDIAIVLRGPAQPVTVRRKERVAGIWVNTDAVRFESVPGFYAVATTRPIDDLADDRTTAIYEIGVRNLQLSPASSLSERITRGFEAGLIAARRRSGLFAENPEGVQITGNVLYRARIAIPSAVPVGEYSAEIHLVRNAQVIASTTVPIRIEKSGFERWIYVMAQEQSLAYGLVAVLAALLAGWIASLATRRS
ncbi:TIGR02186 family protein [Blastomonas fulva]|uniref:TIGR02186 family protein n=1 Tax=Blastomonas fulva TaxID=1550728 RepID=UPI003F72C75E